MSPLCACRVDGRCLSLRLTDGAFSADIFPRDYHHLAAGDRQLLPVKWMAVETLQTSHDDRQLSTASDVVRRSNCCRDFNSFFRRIGFLARDSIYAIARYMPSPVRPSVRPSVRLSVCPSVCHTGGSVKDG